ncbi:Plant self-incompatibility protein S1 family [Raphanus sativus]|uniref:S-protein homolog n=1 Tax=Raphanus sativus TaxID=3726 RepID=A0A6J0NEI4_RAPSA|nr:S-protein homolog 74-like [Raphanus sativus]KAJ4899298.1 Plant self-incompatibility protein S1 family [Raphanus sativus]
MSNIKQFLLAIYISLLLTCQDRVVARSATMSDIIGPKISEWQVMVVNGLTTSETLFIHCKSKEDDLGEHNLRLGDRFSWNFGENMLHTTLFWCYLSKDDSHMNVKVFWDDVILFHRCGWKKCVWTAKTDGLYLWNFANGEDLLLENWEAGW